MKTGKKIWNMTDFQAFFGFFATVRREIVRMPDTSFFGALDRTGEMGYN